MAKITININQQLDRCGDEFLDERDFDMEIDLDANEDYVVCTIGKYSDCYIKKTDLKKLAALLDL